MISGGGPRGQAVTLRGVCVSLRADEHRELERITQRAAHLIALCSVWQPRPCPQRCFPLAHTLRRVRTLFPRPAPCPRPAPPRLLSARRSAACGSRGRRSAGAAWRRRWGCWVGALRRGPPPSRPAAVPPSCPAPPPRPRAGGAAATPAPAAMTTEDEIIRIAKKMDKMVQKKNAVSRGGARRGPQPAPRCLLFSGPRSAHGGCRRPGSSARPRGARGRPGEPSAWRWGRGRFARSGSSRPAAGRGGLGCAGPQRCPRWAPRSRRRASRVRGQPLGGKRAAGSLLRIRCFRVRALMVGCSVGLQSHEGGWGAPVLLARFVWAGF